MRVLAIDTTTVRASVAVVEDQEVLGEVRLACADVPSTRILPAVDFLCAQLGLTPADLDGFAVAIGPGSFTGLRVGIATVEGLALGSGRPVVGVGTLQALAHRIRGTADRLVALMNAYREGVYIGVHDREAQAVEPARVVRPEALAPLLPGNAAFVGEGARTHRALIAAACPGAVFPERSLFLAGALGRIAVARLAAGEGTTPDRLRPLYLREPHIGPPRA
jgi:tRNA threonylcarbamoyladenosine biosynthesis protein TsaB